MAKRNASHDDDAAARAALRIAKEVFGNEDPSDKVLVVSAAIIREEIASQENKPKRNGW